MKRLAIGAVTDHLIMQPKIPTQAGSGASVGNSKEKTIELLLLLPFMRIESCCFVDQTNCVILFVANFFTHFL